VLSEGSGTEEQWEDEANVDATLLLNETLLYGTNISVAQTDILGTIDDSVTADLELAMEYADNLEQTTREINQTLKALNAEYIEPGTGNDPIRNPSALPTGINFYSFDQRLIPDQETQDQGSAVMKAWLESYKEENGEYPNKVAFVLWSVETMRHEGLMEAQIYELLGVKPERSSGRLNGDFNVTPLDELGHPRIDVVIIPSGLYRDTFPFQLELLDNAVRTVADRSWEGEDNYVYTNSVAIEDAMLELGYNETIAHYISRSRIFSEAEGTYGTGVSSAIEASDSWDNVTEVGDLFISRMSNIYGADVWGMNYEDVFKLNLVSLDAAIHSDSSNLYALMDNDDVFQYLGGLDLAYLSLTGNWLSLYIADYTDVDNLEIVDFSEAISKELSARYLNPRWWSAALEHGYAGAREISNVLAYIQGMDLTTGEISDSDWNKLFDAYVNNADYEQYNEAYQAGMATMIDSIRTDAWNDATDEQKASLISEYIESVLDSEAPACCHHTCGNLANQEYMLSLAELYMDQDQVEQYKTIMAESTNIDIYKASTDTSTPDSELSTSDRHSGNSITRSMAASSTSNQSSTTKTGMGENVNVNPENTPKSTTENYVEGYEMVKDTVSDEPVASSYSVSGSDILASALVLALLGAIYVGFWRRRKF
jgi:cobaltochelatase CobN